MSSDEDSETGEWEREQMLRGTQSRRQINQEKIGKSSGAVDITMTRKMIYDDIEKVQTNIESVKWKMGHTRLELNKCEKTIESLTNNIKKLESMNPFFEQIGALEDKQEVLELLERNKSVISTLPHDQREIISIMLEKCKNVEQPMDIDETKST